MALALPALTTRARRIPNVFDLLRSHFRHHGLWAPGVRLLRNLPFPRKALIVAGALFVPVSLLAFSYFATLATQLSEVRSAATSVRSYQHVLSYEATLHALYAEVERHLMMGGSQPMHVKPLLATIADAQLRFQSALENLQGDLDRQEATGRMQAAQTRAMKLAASLAEAEGDKPSPDALIATLDGLNVALRGVTESGKDLLDDTRALLGSVASAHDLRDGALGGLGTLSVQINKVDLQVYRVTHPGFDRPAALRALAEERARAEAGLEESARLLAHAARGGWMSDTQLRDALAPMRAHLNWVAATFLDREPPATLPPQLLDGGHQSGSVILEMRRKALDGIRDSLEQRSLELHGQAFVSAGLLAALVLLALYLMASFYFVVRGGLDLLVDHMERLAEGDLSRPPKARGDDEIADALRSLGVSMERMGALFSAVSRGVASVVHTSSEVATGNVGLSQRTSSAVDGIGRMTLRAQSFSEKMDQCATEVELAVDDARQMRLEATRTKGAMGSLAERLQALQGRSQEIADVVGLIDALSFQTKLLALNASVEAARAGEAGRGFAVVAQEVRALALRSNEAATRIGQILHSSVEDIDRSSTLAQRAREAAQNTENRINSINEAMTSIVRVTRESTDEAQVVLGVAREVEQATEGNVKLMEQLSSASSALQTQGQLLKESVGQFKLG